MPINLLPDSEPGACRVSVVAVPKPFRGHIGTIQRNALRSWRELDICEQIVLLGNDEGVAEAASEVGAIHWSGLRMDEFGTPLVDDVLGLANDLATTPWLCYVNSDILLLPEFGGAVAQAIAELGDCLIVSRRWNLRVNEAIDFDGGWQARLRATVARTGTLFSTYGIDVFVFPKGLFRQVPPFALGRSCWDNWLLGDARRRGFPVVDATREYGVIHQDHDYDGWKSLDEIRRSPQGLRNFWLAGDSQHGIAHTDDATHQIEAGRVVLSNRTSVSVVVPHAGSIEQLRTCLGSLSHQDYPRTFVEIIVVENSPRSLSAPILLEFPFITLTRELKPGPAAARNKGASIAKGDIIAFLDSDCRPSGTWLTRGVAAAVQNRCESVIACNIKPGMTNSGAAAVKWYEAVVFHEQQVYVERGRACITGGMIVPRNVWRTVGPFDEEFTEAACEDWEWSTRASSRGIGIVFAADAVVLHPVHRWWSELRTKTRRLVRGELRLARKRGLAELRELGPLVAAYTRRLKLELATAWHDRRVPLRYRPLVAAAACLVWYWSVTEVRKRLTERRIADEQAAREAVGRAARVAMLNYRRAMEGRLRRAAVLPVSRVSVRRAEEPER